jgi:hypothetical protein
MVGGAHPTGERRDEGASCQRVKTVDFRKSTLPDEGLGGCAGMADEGGKGREIRRGCFVGMTG